MKEIHIRIINPAKTIRLAILLIVIASSIVAIFSGATIPAFAQQAPIDLEKFDLQEIPIPEIPEDEEEEDLIPCLPPPECLLPGAEVCIQVCWPFSEE
jgi:hypothetical protein